MLRRLALRPRACRRLRRHAAQLLLLITADDLDHSLTGLTGDGHGSSDASRIHNAHAATAGPRSLATTQSLGSLAAAAGDPTLPARHALPTGRSATGTSAPQAPSQLSLGSGRALLLSPLLPPPLPPPSLRLSPLARLQRAAAFDPIRGPQLPHRYAAEQLFLDILRFEVRHKPATFSVADIVAGSSAAPKAAAADAGLAKPAHLSLDDLDEESVANKAEATAEAAARATQKFAFGFGGSGGDGDDVGDERDQLLRLCLGALADMAGRDDDRGTFIALKVVREPRGNLRVNVFARIHG